MYACENSPFKPILQIQDVHPFSGFCSLAVNPQNVFFFLGNNGFDYKNSVTAVDLNTRIWTKYPSSPVTAYSCSATYYFNKLGFMTILLFAETYHFMDNLMSSSVYGYDLREKDKGKWIKVLSAFEFYGRIATFRGIPYIFSNFPNTSMIGYRINPEKGDKIPIYVTKSENVTVSSIVSYI